MDRVNWVTNDCFNAIRQLSVAASASVPADQVYARLRSYVDAMARAAQEAGFSGEDTRMMSYAVVALADELAMAQPGALRDQWARQPLQLVYFQDNVAGERFFQHLDLLRGDAERVDVLRVYYLCLLFGFQGKYRVRGAEVALQDLVDSVRRELTQQLATPELLSPEGARPDSGLLRGGRQIPVVWIGAAVLLVSVVLYAALQVALAERVEDVVGWMTRLSAA